MVENRENFKNTIRLCFSILILTSKGFELPSPVKMPRSEEDSSTKYNLVLLSRNLVRILRFISGTFKLAWK